MCEYPVPYALRAEYETNPLGIGTDRPRLSWKLPVRNDAAQSAWQVRAATLPELLETAPDVLDTGKVVSDASVFVPWPGRALASRERVCWQVRVWLAGENTPSGWSDVASFETGLLRREDWSAKWISFGDEGRTQTPPSPYLLRHFALEPSAAEPLSSSASCAHSPANRACATVDQQPVNQCGQPQIERARLYISALGIVDCYLNGQRVHPHAVLAPGWTDFRHRVQTMSFDVTALLRTGANWLGAILADGWYAGYLSCDSERQIYGGAPAFLAQLEIRFTDGSTQTVCTDRNWLGRTGPILSADLYHGEHYDARLEIAGWEAPECSSAQSVDDSENKSQLCAPDTAQWSSVYEQPWPQGLALDNKVAGAVSPVDEIAPRSVRKVAEDTYLFDLGQNFSGWARLRWQGRRGQQVTLRFGEMLNADGTLYVANLRTARATDTYIFSGDKPVIWEPRFTFHGFRYVEVSGLGSEPTAGTITGIVLHSVMPRTGGFHCSDQRVNQLASNICWGLRSNFLEIPTDCPQRDERLGWAGDIQVFARTAAFFYNTDGFLVKWLRDLRDGQREDGAFPDIAPTFIAGFGNTGWADAGVIVPWVQYRRFGDEGVLRENYAAMVAWMDYQQRHSSDGVREPTTYGDWLAVDAAIPQFAPVPSDLVGTAYFAHTCTIMEQVAQVLGKAADARRFALLAQEVRQAFRLEFLTENGRLVGDCQSAYLLALAFDLLGEAQRPAAVERLVELIRVRGWRLSTGFIGTPLLCPVLSRFGRHDVAVRLLLQDQWPSWLFTVKNGATTMWERWDSYTPERGFGDVSMNSFNHYAYGAVGEWMVHWLAGLAPGHEAPAYRHIVFRPQPSERISSASARLDTPYGVASISWQTGSGEISGEVAVPSGAFADFIAAFNDLEMIRDGVPVSLPVVESAQGIATQVRLLAGTYRFKGALCCAEGERACALSL